MITFLQLCEHEVSIMKSCRFFWPKKLLESLTEEELNLIYVSNTCEEGTVCIWFPKKKYFEHIEAWKIRCELINSKPIPIVMEEVKPSIDYKKLIMKAAKVMDFDEVVRLKQLMEKEKIE